MSPIRQLFPQYWWVPLFQSSLAGYQSVNWSVQSFWPWWRWDLSQASFCCFSWLDRWTPSLVRWVNVLLCSYLSYISKVWTQAPTFIVLWRDCEDLYMISSDQGPLCSNWISFEKHWLKPRCESVIPSIYQLYRRTHRSVHFSGKLWSFMRLSWFHATFQGAPSCYLPPRQV